MRVAWDQDKALPAPGGGLVRLPAGEAFEMDDAEAMERCLQGDCWPAEKSGLTAVERERKLRAETRKAEEAAASPEPVQEPPAASEPSKPPEEPSAGQAEAQRAKGGRP